MRTSVLAVAALVAMIVTTPAFAQTARATGTVRDTAGTRAQGRHRARHEPRCLSARDRRRRRRPGPLGDDRPAHRHVVVPRPRPTGSSPSRRPLPCGLPARPRCRSRWRAIPARFPTRSPATSRNSSWRPARCAIRVGSIRRCPPTRRSASKNPKLTAVNLVHRRRLPQEGRAGARSGCPAGAARHRHPVVYGPARDRWRACDARRVNSI